MVMVLQSDEEAMKFQLKSVRKIASKPISLSKLHIYIYTYDDNQLCR